MPPAANSPRVIVPVKGLDAAKSRLAGVLPHAQRQGLVLAMLSDVLAALGAAGLDNVDVLSPDRRVLAFAAACGARPLQQLNPGRTLAQAVDDVAASIDVDALLVLHADLPRVTADELTALLACDGEDQTHAGGGREVILAPDHAGQGTNALLRRPARAIPALFGPDSKINHMNAARLAGVRCVVRTLPGLAHDLDTPVDLAHFRACIGETHTHEFLRRMTNY